jgi:hypothetical protein
MEPWADRLNLTQKSMASIAAARDIVEATRLAIELSRTLIKQSRERLQQDQIQTPPQ